LLNWGTEKKMPVTFDGGRFLTEDEVKGIFGTWPGTVYTITLKVGRGVTDKDFDGSGLDEVALAGTTTTVNAVSPDGTSETVDTI